MIFASKFFLIFLPIVLLGYYAFRSRTLKYRWLLGASWLFYAWCSPQYLWVLLLLTVIDYVAALRIDGTDCPRIRKRWLILSIVSNLGILAAFKYSAFAYDNWRMVTSWWGEESLPRTWNILLPLGISFHTFQGISYTVDVYRRHIPAVRRFLDYALFVSFFPQMAAGPIVRATEFLPQMATPPRATPQQVSDGLREFLGGLFKKLLIADQLDLYVVTPVFADPGSYTPEAHRWASIAWAVQIYCDFSGYSSMAIGIAKWFGFEFPLNFNAPYLARSIPDFWRRWHLSFSTWLRDYLYFPLGGSKLGEWRTHVNLMILFVLCGLWHGATWAWLAYGLLNALYMSAHRLYDRMLRPYHWATVLRSSPPWQVLAWAGTMLQILLGLIIIRMPDWNSGLLMLQSLVGYTHSIDGLGVPAWVPVLVLLGLLGHIISLMQERWTWSLTFPEPVKAMGYALTIAIMVSLAPGVTKTFIYIQF